jgi:Tol biopolymer transport system component
MKEPDWALLPPGVPPHVERLLRRCLRKDPRQRLQDVGDARLDLEEPPPPGGATAQVVSAVPVRGGIKLAIAGAIVALVAGLAVGRFLLMPTAVPVRPVRFEIRTTGVTSAVLSPDGSRLAITEQGKLWVRDLARVEMRPIEGTDNAIRPFWSPDGLTIAASGGTPTAICDLVGGLWDEDAGGAWLADGTIVYSDGNTALFQVKAQGGDPTVILKPDPKQELHFHTVSALPDGRSVIYAVHRGGTAQATDTIAMWSGGKTQVLVQMPGQELDDPVYSPSGHILFERSPTNAGIWAVPFSAASQQVTGEPFLVSQGRRRPSVSADGTLVLLPPTRLRPLGLAIAGRDGNIQTRIDEPRVRVTGGTLSPDGNRVAVAEVADDKTDIWVYDIARHTRTRLTRDGAAAFPVWAPDGRSLLYEIRRGGAQLPGVKQVTADGSSESDVVVDGRNPAMSHDGRTLFFVIQDKDGLRLWYRPIAARDAKPTLFLDQTFYSITAAPSPDNRFVAYAASTTPGQTDIYLRRFPPSEGVWQISTNGGTWPHWTDDGRLLFSRGADIFAVTISTAPEVTVGAPQRVFTRTGPPGLAIPSAFDVAADGKRFLIFEPVADTAEEHISVSLHWAADLAH